MLFSPTSDWHDIQQSAVNNCINTIIFPTEYCLLLRMCHICHIMKVTCLCGEKVVLLDLTWQNMLQISCTSVSQMPLDTLPFSQYSKTYSNHSVLFSTWPFRPLSAGHSKDVWEAFEAFHCSSGKRGKRTISQRWDELKPVKAPHFTSSPLDLHLESSPSLSPVRAKLMFNSD